MQLEVGKTYIARNSDIVTIIRLGIYKAYPFEGDDGLNYTEDGIFLFDDSVHERDLLSEFEPELTLNEAISSESGRCALWELS